jgi:hypothetical protein
MDGPFQLEAQFRELHVRLFFECNLVKDLLRCSGERWNGCGAADSHCRFGKGAGITRRSHSVCAGEACSGRCIQVELSLEIFKVEREVQKVWPV